MLAPLASGQSTVKTGQWNKSGWPWTEIDVEMTLEIDQQVWHDGNARGAVV